MALNIPVWPPGLNQSVLLGGRETPPNNTIRTTTDGGYPKVRMKGTGGTRNYQFAEHFSAADTELLDQFFTQTCKYGAIPFDWIDHRTGLPRRYRFVQPPDYNFITADDYSITLTLESIAALGSA